MIELRLGSGQPSAAVAVAVRPGENGPELVSPIADPAVRDEVVAFLDHIEHSGAAGSSHILPRPGRKPATIVAVGVGQATDSEWRTAGASLARLAKGRWPGLVVRAPLDLQASGLRCLAEGALLASYTFRVGPLPAESAPKLRRVTVDAAGLDPGVAEAAVADAKALTSAVAFARDLTNTPSLQKSPRWFADRIIAAAHKRGANVSATVLDETELAKAGFGGILAIGAGSVRPPRLVELTWRPRRAKAHVVLVGKGITFDTGGISLKPPEGMRLMRKDMGGAAAVCAAVLAAADLNLPVRVTALAPLAENMVSGSAARPGDVVRHYGGLTTEVQNTDAEGRVVLADALAYAVKRLKPDVIVDLATLTGASHVALGRRIAALLTEDDELATALTEAGEASDERMWRLPLADEYLPMLASDVADLNNSPAVGGAGVITAALYLREFTGDWRDRWAHIDMSGPAWADSVDGALSKGATGWGVRMLVRWLSTF